MDKDIMGKHFYNYKVNRNIGVGFIAALFLFVFLFVGADTCSSYGEFELFSRGYEFYLSYKPEKAVEAFETFLKEFPDSSARDAALFWLGKSFIQLKDYPMAERIFADIKQTFPESPFTPHIDKELEILGRVDMMKETEAVLDDAKKRKDTSESIPPEKKEKADILEVKTVKSPEDTRKKEPPVSPKPASLSKVGGEYTVQVGALKNKKAADRLMKKLKKNGYNAIIRKGMSSEGTLFKITAGEFSTKKEAEIFALKLKKTMGLHALPIETGPTKREVREQIKDKDLSGDREETVKVSSVSKEVKEHEIVAVSIEGRRYAMPQILEFMNNASSVIAKLGVKEVLWRTGDIHEDFINEHILYKEAERSGMKGDPEKLKDLAVRHRLTIEEEGYLYRYLVVSDLIGREVANMPGKRVVESLTVSYMESDKNDKALLASDLQAKAKRGISFEEIYKAYTKEVKFAILEFSDLQGWIKERISPLQDGEVSVIWTKDGYMILKPVIKRTSDEMKAFVRKWLEDLRKEAKDIKIIKAD